MLNSYTAASKEDSRWPAEFDVAFCVATGNYELLYERAKMAGLVLISAEDQKVLAIGRSYIAKLKAERELAEVQL